MKRIVMTSLVVGAAAMVGIVLPACGTASFFNPAFLNTFVGGQFPITPGPGASFVMVRGINELEAVVDFIVSIDRQVLVLDDDGNAQVDENGVPITEEVRETVRLRTFPAGLANSVGTLFPCSETPVVRVGLGETLEPGEAAVFVIEDFDPETGAVGVGFGVAAEGLNPLELSVGNFNCGDTILYRVISSAGTGTAGNIRIQGFLQPGSEQPSIFAGPDTFVNYEDFLIQEGGEP